MDWMDIKEKIPQEEESVLLWDGSYYFLGSLCWMEGVNDEIPVFISGSHVVRRVLLWASLPNQPERSKREDPERGCGALNIVETQ